MIFTETKLAGAYVIDIKKMEDNRGFFARAWCQKELSEQGLVGEMVQANLGESHKKGTLRGMHYQVAPHEEVKLLSCPQGAIFDCIVDLRPESPTYKQWVGVELSASNHRMLYCPAGFAHGYQTLTDGARLFYLTSQFFFAESARGVRYNDPAFGIEWPLEVSVLSDKDGVYPDLES